MKMDGKCVNKLRFADDLVLVSKRELEIAIMMEEILKATREGGLEANKKKNEKQEVITDKTGIEEVTKYN